MIYFRMSIRVLLCETYTHVNLLIHVLRWSCNCILWSTSTLVWYFLHKTMMCNVFYFTLSFCYHFFILLLLKSFYPCWILDLRRGTEIIPTELAFWLISKNRGLVERWRIRTLCTPSTFLCTHTLNQWFLTFSKSGNTFEKFAEHQN